MDVQTIHLRKGLPVENGGHILYVFNVESTYLDNLAAYVADGMVLGQQVLIIDRNDVCQQVRERLSTQFTEEDLASVLFEDHRTFYHTHTSFDCELIVSHFENLLQSLPDSNRMIRTWARVVWREEPDIMSKLEQYEKNADQRLHGHGIVFVCAYDGARISAEQLIVSLKHHEYFMTDDELVRSPLYSQPHEKGIFPSLSVQSKIESEIDLYRKKLDFVHAVSHEVRNPLTIVNAYASIMRSTEPNLSREASRKLLAIEQYVSVIDHELTHIIDTEQTLSNDLYMKLEPIHPYQTVQEVVELMKIKSAVQNVTLICQTDVDSAHVMVGNHIGLRLILSNVISNAIKYTAEQGIVEFTACRYGDVLRFVVKDNGIGMTDEQVTMLFKKYGKFDESRGGQGIGLYIVKKLADRFHGNIQFASAPGVGTEVTLDFPLDLEA